MMERLHRLHRLAILRGDLLAIAVLEGRMAAEWRKVGADIVTATHIMEFKTRADYTESELRLLDGNR